jgi:hypothetical protein
MQQLNLPTYRTNSFVIIHKDDDGRIDAPIIKADAKGREFSMTSALRYMRSHKLANDGMRSGWFAITEIALARAKWAI